MQKRIWRVIGVVALVSAGLTVLGVGGAGNAVAAPGDCTADPSTPTTTTSTSTTTTSTTSTTVAQMSSQASEVSAQAAQDAKPVVVTGAGPGGGPHVRVLNPTNGSEYGGFYAYGPEFHGGVFVAAGDVNGDGYDDIVTGAGPGGGPHVKIFNGAPSGGKPMLNELGGFYAYEPNFHGGVSVAVADITGDSKMDIVTAPGAGGGPHVRVFNGATVVGATPTNQVSDEFMAYGAEFTGGVSVAAADMGAGDPRAEIVTAPGPGGGPHVRVFEPNGANTPEAGFGFMAGPPDFSGGLNVAAACVNGAARIAIGTASQISGALVFFPNGAESEGGLFYDTEEEPATFEGLGVALGPAVAQGNPPMQLVTGFSDGDPQVEVTLLDDEADPVSGFDAYGVAIRITVAVGLL